VQRRQLSLARATARASRERASSALPKEGPSARLCAVWLGELLWLESHFPLALPCMKAKLKIMSQEEDLLLKGYCHLQREKGGTEECGTSLAQGMSLSILTIQHKFWKSHIIREIRIGICWLGMKAGFFLKACSPGPSTLQLNANQATELPHLLSMYRIHLGLCSP